MKALDPVAITAAPQTVQLPIATRRLKLVNQSPYLLKLQTGAAEDYLPPGIADLLEVSSETLQIIPSSSPLPSAATSRLLITILNEGESLQGVYPVFVSPPPASNLLDGDLGTGLDGDVVISGATTLTRDMNYRNLTVNAGVTLKTAGFIIRCTGTLTNNGTIDNSGSNGGNATASTGGAVGAGGPGGSLGAGGAGAVGSTNGNATAAGAAPATSNVQGGKGGAGWSGGAGGATVLNPPLALSLASGRSLNYGGGGGGGAGFASVGTGATGGAGGAGGVVMVFAAALAGSGAFQAAGGNAGTSIAGTSANVGGSAGGAGGVVFVATRSNAFTGTLSAAGGAGAAPVAGTGAAGAAGGAGTAGVVTT